MNKTNLIRLSEHFTLAELCKTSHTTATGNTPPPAAINNLKNLCDNWLEPLRHSHNTRYGDPNEPLIISSGYRSPEVNRKAGGSPTSNHTTGCAVDIRCLGLEQAIRYAAILLDLADTRGRDHAGAQASEGTLDPDFDELFIERSSRGTYWLHLAVRPTANRHKTAFVQT